MHTNGSTKGLIYEITLKVLTSLIGLWRGIGKNSSNIFKQVVLSVYIL